jgi:CysZ protein
MSRTSLEVLMICLIATSILMVVWVGGVFYGLNATTLFQTGWLEGTFEWVFTGGAAVLAYVLFPILLPIIASIFLDGFMENIARHEYDKTLHKVKLHQELPKSLMFIGQALLYNLLCLPLYMLLFFTGFTFVLYYMLNGYLLAKEFWVMVCDRMKIKPAHRNTMRGTLLIAGTGFMFIATIPPFTLVMPLLVSAFMVHLGFAALKDGRAEFTDPTKQMGHAQEVIAPSN